ncbi:MAG: hypothetical protein ACLFVP_02500 [Candidatus Bathyarchaeia archaeon]
MPRPKGSVGETKMKIMAVMYHHCKHDEDCYGYRIWQCLQKHFRIYLRDCAIRNVYHHLDDLCEMEYITKIQGVDDTRTLYRITEEGRSIKDQYEIYLDILREDLH